MLGRRLDWNSRRRWFSAALAFSILAVGFAIVSTLWTQNSRDHNPKAHQSETGAPASYPVSSSSDDASVTAHNSTTARPAVVEIPGLVIKISVPTDIKDLTYKTSIVKLRNGNRATVAKFTTKSLIDLDPRCSTSFGPLGSLEKADGQYPSNDQYAVLDYGRLVKQFATFYITAAQPNAACSTSTSVAATASMFESQFASSVSTIQQLK